MKEVNKVASEENKRNRIMEFAFKKFTTEGVAQVTMDDLARGTGMGKGTLYKYFPSKETLLDKTVDYFITKLDKEFEIILSDEKLTPVEKLNRVLKTVAEKLASINPAAVAYLERSLPELFDKIERSRQRIIMKNLTRLFAEGKKAGIFDPQMDEVLVTHMIIGASAHILDIKVFPTLNYSLDGMFNTITSTILKGCLTEQGRKLAFP